jgi:hypothetical protein
MCGLGWLRAAATIVVRTRLWRADSLPRLLNGLETGRGPAGIRMRQAQLPAVRAFQLGLAHRRVDTEHFIR